MIQQITDGSNTCFAQKCSSVTAVRVLQVDHQACRNNATTLFFTGLTVDS